MHRHPGIQDSVARLMNHAQKQYISMFGSQTSSLTGELLAEMGGHLKILIDEWCGGKKCHSWYMRPDLRLLVSIWTKGLVMIFAWLQVVPKADMFILFGNVCHHYVTMNAGGLRVSLPR